MTTLPPDAEELFRRTLIRHYLEAGLRTDDDVQEFLLALKDPIVGTHHNCSQPDHCAQFRAISDVLTDRVRYYVLWTNRAGSKTYFFGGLDTWYRCCHFPNYEVRLLGGSETQATLSYKAMDDFWRISGLEDELLKREARGGRLRKMISNTEWKNGSSASILTASQKAVRGPHPQCLKEDEADEIGEDIHTAAQSQPLGKYGHPSCLGIFSTNHNIGGTMDRILRMAQTNGTPIYKYCIWEVLASCRDYACSTCKLSGFCPGRHMRDADGYYKIDDFLRILETLSMDSVMREWFCIKVGHGDMVYQQEWDEELHVKGMPGFDRTLPVTLSIDWGGTHPFSVGVWQWFSSIKRHVRVAEVFLSPATRSVTNTVLLRVCRAHSWWLNVTQWTADPARADLIQEWLDAFNEEGRTVTFVPHSERDIDVGVNAVKGALRPVLGNPAIGVHYSCLDCRREFTQYRAKKINEYESKIVDENNHTMDDLRMYVMQFVRASGSFAFFYDSAVNVDPD